MRLLISAALACGLLSWTHAASAQGYPARAITFIANYPPGGAVDVTARIVAEKLSKILGTSIVVENRPGGTGAIGAASVSRAENDGYTILVTANPAITIVPVLTSTSYDPVKDLTPIAKVAVAATVVSVVSDSPYKDFKELVEAAKRPDGKVLVGVTGAGSAPDIEIKLLNQLARSNIGVVPYNGAAPIINDVLGGHITAGAAGLPPMMAQIQDGKMRGIAVVSPTRSTILPEVPTVRETLGLELDGFPTWYGFLAPPRVPQHVVERLEAGILEVMRDPAIHEKMTRLGYEIVLTGSAAFAKENLSEIDRLKKVVSGGLKAVPQ